MKKILSLLFVLATCVAILSSCFSTPDNGGNNGNNGTNPGGDTSGEGNENQNPEDNNGGGGNSSDTVAGITLFVAKPNYYINEGDLINSTYKATGVMPVLNADLGAIVDGTEIVFGKCDREISEMAEDYMSELPLTSDDAVVLIYRKNNDTAIIWNADYITTEYAVDYYLKHFVSTYGYVGSNIAEYQIVASISEYDRKLEEEKWANISTKLSPEALVYLKNIYSLFGDDTWTWVANLYDPDIGGFYYSNSARDYVASGDHYFLPDIESTGQAFGILRKGGMFDILDGRYQDALTDEMRQKLGEFTYNLQDPDGYFYHPQWGKDISTAGRSRNLGSAVAILNRLGIKPKYTLPTEQLEDVEETSYNLTDRLRDDSHIETLSSLAQSNVLACAGGLPAHLLSEEAFLAYLNKLDFKNDSYSSGHTLSSQSSEIKAAGLAKVCIEFLDSIQNPENGLWEKAIDYDTISGFLKISTTYQSLGGKLKYTDKAVESAMSLVLSPAMPNMMTRLYNPITAVSNVLTNLARQGSTEEINSIRAYVKSVAAEFLSITYDKLMVFYRGDGSFSYYQKACSTVSQGNVVAIECAEGDMNSTHLAIGVYNGIFKLLNLSSIRLFENSDLDGFMDLMQSLGTIVKSEYGESELIEPPTPVTFDDGEIPDNILPKMTGTNGSYTSVVTDPSDSDNKLLEFKSLPGYGDYIYFTRTSSSAEKPNCYVFSVDINFAEIKDVTTTDIRFVMEGLYYVDFAATKGTITLEDNSNKGNSSFKNKMPFTLKTGKTYNLTFKYHIVDTVAYIETYVDGKLMFVSDNYIGRSTAYLEENQPAASLKYKRAYFFALKNSNLTVHFDNVILDRCYEEFTPPAPPVDPDLAGTPEVEGFEGEKLPSSVTTTLGGVSEGSSVGIVTDPKNEENKVVEFKSVSGYTDYLYFERTGSTSTEPNCYVFSFDIDFNKLKNTTTAEMRFVMNGLYYVNLNSSGDIITLSDNSNAGANSVSTDMPFTLSSSGRYNITFKYHLVGNRAYIETFVDGKLMYVSNNYVGRSLALSEEEQPDAPTSFKKAHIFGFKSASFTVYVDNVLLDRTNEEFVVPDFSKRPVGDITFDDSDSFPDGVSSSVGSAGGSVSIVDKDDTGDKCVLIDTKKDGQDFLTVDVGEVSAKKGTIYVFEADLRFNNSSVNQIIGRIQLVGLYQLDLRSHKDKKLQFESYETDNTEILGSVNFGAWFTLRIEYHILSDSEAKIITYLNGNVLETVTKTYKGTELTSAKIYSLKAGVYKLYVDNVYIDVIDELPVNDEITE